VVEARFYEDIADELGKGALAVLEQAGVSFERHRVPGAFEVPAAIRFAIAAMESGAAHRAIDGFVALGCVIRGETDHYDHICREVSRALMDLAVRHHIALGFGILTCATWEQAWARAAVSQRNKGADAAAACLRMMELQRSMRLVAR
jgi:6,7-dimethyl-8-ribityllumazine synthase